MAATVKKSIGTGFDVRGEKVGCQYGTQREEHCGISGRTGTLENGFPYYIMSFIGYDQLDLNTIIIKIDWRLQGAVAYRMAIWNGFCCRERFFGRRMVLAHLNRYGSMCKVALPRRPFVCL